MIIRSIQIFIVFCVGMVSHRFLSMLLPQNKSIRQHNCPIQRLQLNQSHYNQRNKSITHRAQHCLCICHYVWSDISTEWGWIGQRHGLIEAIETHKMRPARLFDAETHISWHNDRLYVFSCQSNQTTLCDLIMSKTIFVPKISSFGVIWFPWCTVLRVFVWCKWNILFNIKL